MTTVTESDSLYNDLEKMTVRQLLESINREDRKVPEIVYGCIPVIEKLVEEIVPRMRIGGRLFYIGDSSNIRA
jgi:N-acetylmuramic acid 6-phosphate etherase